MKMLPSLRQLAIRLRSQHGTSAMTPYTYEARRRSAAPKSTFAPNSAIIGLSAPDHHGEECYAKDYTLMAPFGGTPTRGFDTSPERRKAIARFFNADTFHQEVVATYGSGDMIVLVTIERVHGRIGGLQEQDWSLRVTQVYRRAGAAWQLVHRHADPLANGVSLEQAAALARGDQR